MALCDGFGEDEDGCGRERGREGRFAMRMEWRDEVERGRAEGDMPRERGSGAVNAGFGMAETDSSGVALVAGGLGLGRRARRGWGFEVSANCALCRGKKME